MSRSSTHASQPSRLVMARSRGVVVGTLLMALGAWGALIPFIGHSFGYGYTPDTTWSWTASRGWLEVLPGAVTFVSGVLIMYTARRVTATLGGYLAALSGAWFVIGTVISPIWSAGYSGAPSGDTTRQVLENIGMFSGLGLVIVFLAAVAIGRSSVIGVRDVAAGQARLDAADNRDDNGGNDVYPEGSSSASNDTVPANASAPQHS
jgi:hypothetical protein